MAGNEVSRTGGGAKKLAYQVFRFVMGKGEIPSELLIGLIIKRFPAYKLEELQDPDFDIGPLVKMANLLGTHEAIVNAKANGFKGADAFIVELLDYDMKQQTKRGQ